MPRPQKPRKPETARVRAGKACKRCNQKRIKCDAMLRIPCGNCAQSNAPECVLRPTRRGTYIRKSQSKGQHAASRLSGDAPSEVPFVEADREQDSLTRDTDLAVDTSAPVQEQDQNHTAASPRDASSARPASFSQGSWAARSPDQPSLQSEGNGSSYRDISWSTMFDHFVNSRRNKKEFVDKCSITYLGESFPLAIVLDDLNEGGRLKLHHPGPPLPGHDPSSGIPDQQAPAHLLPEDLDYLRTKGVFDLPEKQHLDALMTVFLDRVYPAYPLVNRQELMAQHAAGEVPLILLYSICFIATTFCPLSLLHQAGYQSRRDARFGFYKKVKVLFDSGYEINKIVILQSAICMTFWGGGPNNYWNFYSWISTAVTIAEGIGIHRSTVTTNMQPQDKSLLRRIWWILVVRDSSCSALVGRPFRIDIAQSDTEMLLLEDFAHDAPSPGVLDCSSPQSTYAQYQIQIARLSLILRDIVNGRFSPGRPRILPNELQTRLHNWRESLPAVLAWNDDPTADLGTLDLFTMTLAVQYNHHIILLYLGQPLHQPGVGETVDEEYTQAEDITDAAAQQISAVACTMVTRSVSLLMPHEFFHGIFLAQAVFYTKLRSSHKLVAQLGRSALTNCQMVLHEARECWDPSPWIMQLFNGLCSRVAEGRLRGQDSIGNSFYQTTTAGEMNGIMSTANSTPEAGVFNGLLGYEPWQSNPMLSSLFDMPLEMLLPQ
ncbi:Zn(II)2Cys6 transcription factor [Aspergillus lucknowensis]|uniref:Fungal-specific transcription factor domain-containing protein n=1 Tax=Aspergillus lucknowensis TaxID=176173 RepID=A0ABR4LI89_9EURO